MFPLGWLSRLRVCPTRESFWTNRELTSSLVRETGCSCQWEPRRRCGGRVPGGARRKSTVLSNTLPSRLDQKIGLTCRQGSNEKRLTRTSVTILNCCAPPPNGWCQPSLVPPPCCSESCALGSRRPDD